MAKSGEKSNFVYGYTCNRMKKWQKISGVLAFGVIGIYLRIITIGTSSDTVERVKARAWTLL